MAQDPPPDWPDRQWSTWHEIGGIRWHVQRQGAGPLLLLVHGTGGGTHSWAGVTAALAAHYDVVALDLPGHAFTTVSEGVERRTDPFSLPGMAHALAALLDALQLRPTLVAGHSAGVPVLLRLLLDNAIAPQRIVGFCPALVAPPRWYVTLAAPLVAQLVERSLVAAAGAQLAARTALVHQMLRSTGSRLTDAQLARYRLLCTFPSHVHAALTMMARWDLPALYRDIHRLTTPIQLVAGRADRWIPLASLTSAVARIPGAQLTVEAAGHLLPEEEPALVLRHLLP